MAQLDRIVNALLLLVVLGILAVPVGRSMAVPDKCEMDSLTLGCTTPPTYLPPAP